MKHLLILFFVGLSVSAFAQKSDTLTIPVGKYQFIKVGDKIYKLVTSLEEVKEFEQRIDSTYPIWRFGGSRSILTPIDTTFNTWQLMPISEKEETELFYLDSLTRYLDKTYNDLLNFKLQ